MTLSIVKRDDVINRITKADNASIKPVVDNLNFYLNSAVDLPVTIPVEKFGETKAVRLAVLKMMREAGWAVNTSDEGFIIT